MKSEQNEQLDVQTKLLHPQTEHPMNAHTFPVFYTSTFVFDSTQQGADFLWVKVMAIFTQDLVILL